MVLLTREEVAGVHTVPDLPRCSEWIQMCDSFVAVVGDPRNDLRLFAAIPDICARVATSSGDGLSPIPAAQVGLARCNSRCIVHLMGNDGDPSNFAEKDSWNPAKTPELSAGHETKAGRGATASSSVSKDNVAVMGPPPRDDTDTQLAARHRRVYVLKQAPYVDFAIWLPFWQESPEESKFQSLHAIG